MKICHAFVWGGGGVVNDEKSFVCVPDFVTAHFFEGFEGEGCRGVSRHDGIHVYDGDVACGHCMT